MKIISLFATMMLAACAMNTPSATPVENVKETAMIGGVIQYPGQALPSLRICALDRQTQGATCVKTKSGESRYRIANLPAGDYQIIAEARQGHLKVGGHMLQVQCIRAPCPAQLKSVSLQPGQVLEQIDLNGFYESREDFPAMPKEN